MSYNFLTLAEDVLKCNDFPMTIDDMWKYAEKNKIIEKLNTSGKTPWKTLGARIYVDIKENERTKFKQFSKRPAKFGLINKEYDIDSIEEDVHIIEEPSFNERDLHPLLSIFVINDQHFRCYTKTIYHEVSKKKNTGKNKWLHPDIVGVYFPYEEFHEETIKFMKCINKSAYKIFSFEMKKSINFGDIREKYFQAVSNSSWANEGYLVTLEMDESDEFINELRRLNNAFGIGIIKLNPLNIAESEIICSAVYNEKLDWDTIDKLCENNPDFKNFLETISDTYNLSKIIKSKEYDEILDDTKYTKYIKEHHIVD